MKITIGTSDYTRSEIEDQNIGWTIGCSSYEFLEKIRNYEMAGYTVEFNTSIFRRIFALGIYKVTAEKK